MTVQELLDALKEYLETNPGAASLQVCAHNSCCSCFTEVDGIKGIEEHHHWDGVQVFVLDA